MIEIDNSLAIKNEKVGTMSRNSRRGQPPRLGLPDQDSMPTFFVPALGVNRGVSLEAKHVKLLLRAVRESLDGKYTLVHPSKLCLAGIDKAILIEKMRQARIKPEPEKMRDLAFSTAQGLRELLGDSPPQLQLPIGKIDRFGPGRNHIGLGILGWRGYSAHYAERDAQGVLLPVGTIVAEHQLELGAIGAAMAGYNPRFMTDGLAATPYVLLASRPRSINDNELHRIQQGVLARTPHGVAFDELTLNDPVIYLSVRRDQHKPEIIPVRDTPLALAPPSEEAM